MLKKILSFFTITILCLGMAGCGSEGNTSKENNTGTTSENYAEEKEGTEAETDNHTIMVTIGEQKFEAILEDNKTAEEFSSKLPVTFDMSELNGNEKYFNMDVSIHSEPEQVGKIEEGDLMLYGSDCVVLFYDSFSTGYSYTRIGKIKDVSGLREAVGKGNVTVSFEHENKEDLSDDDKMPTRTPMEGGTRINMYFGDTLIPGILNDCKTAQALIEKLPVTQHVSRYSHDFCGITEELPYDKKDEHNGWMNGDIDYATDAPYFTILFEDEEISEQYGNQVNIGVIDCPLSKISNLDGDYDVRIELAE